MLVSGPVVLIALLCACAFSSPDSGGPSGTQHSALSDSECQPSRFRDSVCSYRAGLVFAVLVGGVLVFASRLLPRPRIRRVRTLGLLCLARSELRDCCLLVSLPPLSWCEHHGIALGVLTHSCPMNLKQKSRAGTRTRDLQVPSLPP